MLPNFGAKVGILLKKGTALWLSCTSYSYWMVKVSLFDGIYLIRRKINFPILGFE